MSTTIARLGRRLRLGVVGGGPGSFIGTVHRTAARIDDHYEIVAAVMSRNPERSRAAARHRAERAYPDHGDLGFHEAFANLYAGAAEAIVARRTGARPDPLALDFPTILLPRNHRPGGKQLQEAGPVLPLERQELLIG